MPGFRTMPPPSEICVSMLGGFYAEWFPFDSLCTRRLGGNSYGQAPQHFLYFLPLPQGQGSLRPTLAPERTTCWTCISPDPAMRACSSSFFFLRWKDSSISSTEVATCRGGRPLPPRPPVMTDGTLVSSPSPDGTSGPAPGLVPRSGGRSMICIKYK